jgi:TRAP-type C4-dicarboxylate transport system substrate-binding protein
LAGEGLRALGANAIGMPVPQVPESLANGVIDGAVVPWEIVPALKLQELVKFHTEVPGSPTFYSTSFVLAMNSPKYNSLPNDLKAIIDARSGMFGAAMAGKMWDDQAVAISAMVKARAGNTVSTISVEEAKLWQEKTKPVTENWIKQAKEKGLPAENMLADAQALIKKYS